MDISNHWKGKVNAIMDKVVMAPSSHNTQPWRFHLLAETIDLYADHGRVLSVNDPDNRELTISCGCALLNLRLAAAFHGVGTRVEPFPDLSKPNWLARISMDNQSSPSRNDADLSVFIDQRRTYRRRFLDRTADKQILDFLIAAAREEHTTLLPLLDQQSRAQAGSLIAEGDAIQWANPDWRNELASWMRPRMQGDGLPVTTLFAPLIRLLVSKSDMGKRIAKKNRKLAEAAPILVVLTTEMDNQQAWLEAGQALQRVLLVACKHGLQASYFNQPVQIKPLRPKLQNMLNCQGCPQILLGLGHPAGQISPAPRRTMAEVLI